MFLLSKVENIVGVVVTPSGERIDLTLKPSGVDWKHYRGVPRIVVI